MLMISFNLLSKVPDSSLQKLLDVKSRPPEKQSWLPGIQLEVPCKAMESTLFLASCLLRLSPFPALSPPCFQLLRVYRVVCLQPRSPASLSSLRVSSTFFSFVSGFLLASLVSSLVSSFVS